MGLLEKIAFSHVQLAKIHPFLDGNRCAPSVLNFQLMKNGFAPVVIIPTATSAHVILKPWRLSK